MHYTDRNAHVAHTVRSSMLNRCDQRWMERSTCKRPTKEPGLLGSVVIVTTMVAALVSTVVIIVSSF